MARGPTSVKRNERMWHKNSSASSATPKNQEFPRNESSSSPGGVLLITFVSVSLCSGILTFSVGGGKAEHVGGEGGACGQGVPLDCPWSPEAGGTTAMVLFF